MTLATDKKKLTTEVTRYITLLSALTPPPTGYINSLHYFRGLVNTANKDEIGDMQEQWDALQPNDPDSLAYIESGKQLS